MSTKVCQVKVPWVKFFATHVCIYGHAQSTKWSVRCIEWKRTVSLTIGKESFQLVQTSNVRIVLNSVPVVEVK